MKVISKAPTRISLLGGGTDFPDYYNTYGGAVLSMAINIRQEFEIERVSPNKGRLDLPSGSKKEFLSAFFDSFGLDINDFNLTQTFRNGIESGSGSSASAAVALLGGLHKLLGIIIDKNDIAGMAWDVEVNKLKLFGGIQDQYAASYGGFNYIIFSKLGVEVRPITRTTAEKLAKHTLLFYTGKKRENSKIQEQFKYYDKKKIRALQKLREQVINSLDKLDSPELIGKILDKSWEQKKKSNPLCTNERIDFLYHTAKRCGAWGGKVIGAGGGGYMIVMSNLFDQERIIQELTSVGCDLIDYSVDYNGLETRRI